MTAELRLGRWQDVLADVECDALICDPPYSERTHAGADSGLRGDTQWRRSDGTLDLTKKRRPIAYAHWSRDDLMAFCAHWSPRVRGWIAMLVDHTEASWAEAAWADLGRYCFAPLPCVEVGRTVRFTGDGPSSWTSWLVVARPRSLSKWGTLPGAYVGNAGDWQARSERHIGGKPISLMRAIVRDYSRPGDLICDPTAGYATTGVAALTMGRRFIGAEMDPETHAKGAKRLAETQVVDLFDHSRAKQPGLEL